jgi:hypothetical protein
VAFVADCGHLFDASSIVAQRSCATLAEVYDKAGELELLALL